MLKAEKFYVAHADTEDEEMWIETFDTIEDAVGFFKSYTDGERAILYITYNEVYDTVLDEK